MTTPIYTIDLETDPFKHGRVPSPFAAGIYNGEWYADFWGKDCVHRLFDFLNKQAPGIVYAHNGGKFDFFYMMDYLINHEMMIMGSRIVSVDYEYALGKHEFRDSYSIMPFSLKKFKGGEGNQKLEIDIDKLEKKVREKNKVEIKQYLKMDCVVLWNLCTRFIETFDAKIKTVGTASMGEFRKIYEVGSLTVKEDTIVRGGIVNGRIKVPGYYYGGRVECFERGIVSGNFKIYDVNSMYPYVMKNFMHPIGKPIYVGNEITENTWFLSVEGKNYGAFPAIVNGVTRYDTSEGVYHVTRHEFDAAVELGLFELKRVIRAVDFDDLRTTFIDFVDKFYNLRIQAKEVNDEMLAMFWKYILNSCYGKFGQNPDNYSDQRLTDNKVDLSSEGYRLIESIHYEKFKLWERPSRNTNRYNVATGASITGAARSVLLRGIAKAKRPLYCDTDSLICEGLDMAIDGKELGAWKLEGKFNLGAIVGRKTYAMFETRKNELDKLRRKYGNDKNFDKQLDSDGAYCVKLASKGVNITPTDVWNICNGEEIVDYRDAPSYKLDGSHNFIHRTVRMTA